METHNLSYKKSFWMNGTVRNVKAEIGWQSRRKCNSPPPMNTSKIYLHVVKRCSSLLIIGEMQIKTTMRYHLTPERPSLKSLQITNAGDGVEKREPSLHCWWECKLVQSLWRTVWRFLKNLKIELPYDPAIPLLGI